MNEAVRKEILDDLQKTIAILDTREFKDIEELKELSDHAVEDVAVQKDLDLISVTVLIYSLYKIVQQIKDNEYKDILTELKFAQKFLQQNNLGRYNKCIKSLYTLVRQSHGKIKEHLDDVLHAARIKKGSVLLHKGLSIGQAAGLMGLTNWDLQQYAGHTVALEQHQETFPAKERLLLALKIFGVKLS